MMLADLRARLERGLRRQALKKEKEEFTAEAEKSWMLANLQRDLNMCCGGRLLKKKRKRKFTAEAE